MDLLRVDRLPAMPWKNGGGTTRRIAASPPDADFDVADWRVDLSDITRPGPFSHLAGVDRLLMPLATGLRLGLDGGALQPVGIFQSIAFDGGAPVVCDLAAEAPAAGVPAFNLLLRRGRCVGRLQAIGGPGRLHESAVAIVLYAARGGFNLVLGGERPRAFDAGHAAVVRDTVLPLAFEPYRPWSMLVAASVHTAPDG